MKKYYRGPVKFSTTNEIAGYTIVEHKDVVYERVVAGVSFITEFFAGFSDFFGGRSGKMEGELDRLYRDLMNGMAHRAERIGANAVVGYSVDIDEISGKGTMMLMISGTGTAVVIEEKENTEDVLSAHLSDSIQDKNGSTITGKSAMWACTKCGTQNGSEARFCVSCGERRHSDWKCATCGIANKFYLNFCPVCGKARTVEDEQTYIDEQNAHAKEIEGTFNRERILNLIASMKNANEVYECIQKEIQESGNADAEELVARLKRIAQMERAYGNSKDSAQKELEGYFNHNCTIFTIDREGEKMIECPECGVSQRNDRWSCRSCGALFR